MVSFNENMQYGMDESVRSLSNKQELLAKVVELFPYPIQIFTLDGTAKMINKAAVEMIGIRNIESHVGKYNVFEDPVVRKSGVADQVRQVLKGKTVFITDFNTPYQEIMRHYNLLDRDIQTINADITCFPLMTDGVIEYFAAVFFFKKIYRGKEEVEMGRRYIEAHWKEPYDAEKTAKAACLSKSHFTKLFKKHTGVTPREYYMNYKTSKLKEALLDTNLSISQAFAACNMNYNGNYARIFRKKTGVSPSDYRKLHGQQP